MVLTGLSVALVTAQLKERGTMLGTMQAMELVPLECRLALDSGAQGLCRHLAGSGAVGR